MKGNVGGLAIVTSPGYIKKTFKNLVPHNILFLTLQFTLTGDWQPSDWFSVSVDGVSSIQWSLSSKITSSSGVTCKSSSSPAFRSFVIGKIFHTADSVTLTINFSVAHVGSGPNSPTIGIRDVTILQKYSQPGDSQGFYVTVPGNTVPSSTGCNEYSYKPTLGASCQSCSSSTCYICSGLGGNNCLRSNWASYFDGTDFSSCAPKCTFCTGPNANDCVQCDDSYTLDTDNTCQTGCNLPYVPSNTLFPRCWLPCNSGQYLYWNNTCRDSCDYPLQVDINSRQCAYPCNKAYAQFLYWNGSCLLTCPFSQRNENGYAFCDFCPVGYYFHSDENKCKLGCIYPYIVRRLVYCELDLSSSDLEQTATISKVISTGNLAQGIGSIIPGFLSPSDPSGFTLVALTKMLLYTRYMDLSYSPRLQSVLDQQDAIKPSVKFLQKAQSLVTEYTTNYPLPGRFNHYRLHSSFLVNFFELAIILVAVFIIALIFSFSKCCCRQGTLLKTTVEKIKDALQWNLLIMLYTSHYDGVILYTSLEIRTTNSFHSFVPVLSFLLSITSVTLAALIFFKVIKTIGALRTQIGRRDTQEHQSQVITEFTQQHGRFQVFYASIRGSDLMQQSFFVIFTSRLILFHIIIAALIYHPFIQAILILLMSICMVLYLCLKYPIKSKLRLGQYIIQEILLLAVNTCVVIVACIDLSQKDGYSTREITGEIFLYINMVLSMLGPVFTVLMVIEKLIALKQRKENLGSSQVESIIRNILPVNIVTRAPQGRLKSNNESNLVLVEDGLDQSQIDDTSLRPSDSEFTSQLDRQRNNVLRSNQGKTKNVMTTDHNASKESISETRQAYRARLDQPRAHELSIDAFSNKEIMNPTKHGRIISDSYNQSTVVQFSPKDLNESKRKKNDKFYPSLDAQDQQRKKINVMYDDHSSSQSGSDKLSSNFGNKSGIQILDQDRMASNILARDEPIELDQSLKKSTIEASWLRANQGRRYRIRGLEQDLSGGEQDKMSSVENSKYSDEPTYGNHSGVINQLRIKRPRDLGSKQGK